jgi:hypothetical protein
MRANAKEQIARAMPLIAGIDGRAEFAEGV